MKQSNVEIAAEVKALHADYAAFLAHLAELGIDEVPPLAEFAVWRNQEFQAHGKFTNPILSIH